MADGQTVLGALDPARLTDADLPGLYVRMFAILDTVEMPRCEGRLMPRDLFERIDTLHDRLRHGPAPKLLDWAGLVADFGEHYGLAGSGPIAVDPGAVREAAAMFPGITLGQ